MNSESIDLDKLIDLDVPLEYIRTHWSAPFPTVPDATIEAALADMYAAAGMKKPLIIWFESPWQMTVAPMLLESLLRAAWRKQLQHLLVNEQWKRCLDQILRQMDEATYQKLIGAVSFNQQITSFWQKVTSQILKGLVGVDTPADTATLGMPIILGREVLASSQENIWRQAGALMQRHTSEALTRNVLQPESAPQEQQQSLPANFRAQRPPFDSLFPENSKTLEIELIEQLGEEACCVLASRLGCDTGPLDNSASARLPIALLAASRFNRCASSIARLTNQFGTPFFYRCALLRHLLDGPKFNDASSAILDSWGTVVKSQTLQFIFRDVCLVCRLPTNPSLDAEGRLHSEKAPALAFSDGFKFHSWHGTTIPDWLSLNPEILTVERIEIESNIEIRRAMLEMYGEARFLQESGAEAIHEDACGVLYRKSFVGFEEPLVMVRVRNSTAEPDGTYKHYYLRVPPNMRTATEAVAWTFTMIREESNQSSRLSLGKSRTL